MKIVLRQDVPKLGEAGSVQEVSNGYARNFLIPQGMAVVATAGELKVAANNQAVKDRKIVKQEQQLQALADRINGQRLEFTARAGTQGRLYGSITAGDVAERLSAAVGEEIDRRRVVLDDPIRSVGEHAVTVHLVGRLRPQVRVVVQGEADEAEAAVAATDADAATGAATGADAGAVAGAAEGQGEGEDA
jgi:large subunit ribosomal protein L9